MPKPRRSFVIGLVAAIGLAAVLLARRQERAAPRDAAPERMQLTSFVLPNGLAVELLSGPCGDRVGVALLFAVGADHDPEDRSGMTQIVARLLASSAPANRVETARDHTRVSVVVPAGALDATLAETASLIARKLTEADFTHARAALLAELGRRAGDPGLMALSHAIESIRPTRGGGFRGVAAEVEAIDLAQLQAFVAGAYTAANARLVVAGRFEAAQVRRRIEQAFGSLAAGTAPAAREPSHATVTGTLVMGDAPAAAALAVPAPPVVDASYPAFLVLASRLLEELAGASAWRASYEPIASPETLVVTGLVRPAETPDATGARLRSDVAAVVERPLAPSDLVTARERFGRLLGVDELVPAACGADPGALAIARARRVQLGLHGLPWADTLARTTQAELERVAPRFTGTRTAAVIAGGTIR